VPRDGRFSVGAALNRSRESGIDYARSAYIDTSGEVAVAVRKPIINPKQAVQFIRMGISDEGLMQKYGITARGLESLFRKLVRAGELDRSELEQRTELLDRSQSVVLASATEPVTPKIQISSAEAIQAVRSGMSDLNLMRQFSLSAKGVDKLFRKLVLAGLLDEEELEQRAQTSQMFQVAELDELPEPIVPKPRVKAADAVRAIRDDMSDAELMERYGLSSKGLESLFRKLVKAGQIMQAELDQRLLGTQSSHYVDLDEPVRPSPAKCKIKAAEAIHDIRSGMSDVALMKKYAISIKGLDSLFRKLILSGNIERAELDRRSFVSPQSHFVDLEEQPEPTARKIRVKASELAACIRDGMNDAALMERFSLSARGLQGLFRKLAAAGRISGAELDARRNAHEGAELSLDKTCDGTGANGQRQEEEGEFELESSTTSGWLRLVWEDHKGGILAGSVVIALLVVAIVLDSYCVLGSRLHQWTHARRCPDRTSAVDSQKETAELTAIFEDIGRNPYRKAALDGIPDAEDLQECLRNCKGDHGSTEPAERGLLLNCRMECMSKHGKAIKAIRKRYYGEGSTD
jgi:hypothetical protein